MSARLTTVGKAQALGQAHIREFDANQSRLEAMDQPIKRSRWKPFLMACLIGVAVIGSGWFASTQINWAPEATAYVSRADVKLDTVQRAPFRALIFASGVLEPSVTMSLQNSVAGRVEKLHANPGDHVNAGDTIIELSNPEIELNVYTYEVQVAEQLNALSQASQNVRQIENEHHLEILRMERDLTSLREELGRNRKLSTSGVKAAIVIEDLERQVDYAENLLKKRREMLSVHLEWKNEFLAQAEEISRNMYRNRESTRRTLDSLHIRAQIDGTLSEFNVRQGEFIERGRELGSQYGAGTPLVKTQVDEFYLHRLDVGNTARWTDPHGEVHELVVRRVIPQVNDGKINLKLAFVNEPPNGLAFGQRLDLEIQSGEEAEQLIVANDGFLGQTAGNWIFLLDETTNEARRVPIKVQANSRNWVAIENGLRVGDTVVVSHYQGFANVEKLVIEDTP